MPGTEKSHATKNRASRLRRDKAGNRLKRPHTLWAYSVTPLVACCAPNIGLCFSAQKLLLKDIQVRFLYEGCVGSSIARNVAQLPTKFEVLISLLVFCTYHDSCTRSPLATESLPKGCVHSSHSHVIVSKRHN